MHKASATITSYFLKKSAQTILDFRALPLAASLQACFVLKKNGINSIWVKRCFQSWVQVVIPCDIMTIHKKNIEKQHVITHLNIEHRKTTYGSMLNRFNRYHRKQNYVDICWWASPCDPQHGSQVLRAAGVVSHFATVPAGTSGFRASPRFERAHLTGTMITNQLDFWSTQFLDKCGHYMLWNYVAAYSVIGTAARSLLSKLDRFAW